MALADSHSRLLSAIDDYGEFGRKQNRKEGVMRGLEMLNESLSAAMERRRRKKEAEQARLDRAAEIEQGRKDDQAKEQRGVDRELFNANVKAEEERLKKDAEKKEKEEAKAANLPKIQSINAKFKAAIQAKDDNAFADALEEYSYLDEDFQKLVPLAAHQKRFDKVMEPPKQEKGPTPSEQLAQMKMEAIVDLQKKKMAFDQGQIDIEELKSAYANAAMFDASAFDKIPDWVFGEGGSAGTGGTGTGPDAFSGSEIQKLSDKDSEFGSASGVMTITPRVLTQIAIAKDLGIPVDEEAILKNPASLEPMTTGARISKKKFAAVMDAYASLNEDQTNDPAAVRQALDEAYQSYGIPVERGGVKKSVSERIMSGDNVPEDYEEAAIDPEELRSEIETKYPDIYDLLRDDDGTIAEAIDDEYGVSGLADYLMLNQVSSATTGRSFLAQ